MLNEKAKEDARKFALKNAMDYGKANLGAVLSKVLASNPELKKEIKEVSAMIGKIVDDVNSMRRSDLEDEFEKHAEEFKEKEKIKEEKNAKPRMELEGAVTGHFNTRFAPEPNGYAHIGSAKATWLAREFADIYKGTVALYFDDTNPEKEKQEYVDELKRDFEWLGVRFDREYYSSDHVEKMYEYAEKLIKEGNAYACTCERERMKELRFAGKECEHRQNEKAKNMHLWMRMLSGEFKDNEMVLRLKLDMAALNTTMRDPVIFRIIDHAHYRQGTKYKVWPTYDMNTPVVDSLEGITDVLRDKNWEMRDELYNRLLDLLGLRKPKIRSMSRIEISGNLTSKRKTNALIQEGKLSGYDDPRLITISGLRRRGIQPQAIRNFVLKFGMSKSKQEVKMEMLLAENRIVIDGIARRLFMVQEPVELKVSGIPKEYGKVKLRLHPSNDLGQRECKVSDTFLISGSDAETLDEGDVFRLKDLFNVKVEKMDKHITAKFDGNEAVDAPKFQWVNAKDSIKCKIIRIDDLLVNDEFNPESMTASEGYAEEYVKELKQNEIVQFERIGFFKLDDFNHMTFIAL